MSTPHSSAQAGNSETHAIRVTSNTRARATKELEDEVQKELNNHSPHADTKARIDQLLNHFDETQDD